MSTLIIARAYVGNAEAAKEFEENVFSLYQAEHIARQEGLDMRFGLKISVPSTQDIDKKMSQLDDTGRTQLQRNYQKTQQHIQGATAPLWKTGWVLGQTYSNGQGESFREAAFAERYGAVDPVAFCLDLDQFVLDETGLLRLDDLAKKMVRDDKIIGLGVRDVPIVLGYHDKPDKIRQVHEHFHMETVNEMLSLIDSPETGYRSLTTKDIPEGRTPAYWAIGESTPGCYATNKQATHYPQFVGALEQAYQQGNFTRQAGEYLFTLMAAKVGGKKGIAWGDVSARPNKMPKKTEEQEYQGVCTMIQSQTAELGKTEVGPVLQETLENLGTSEIIAEFYDGDIVKEVHTLMYDALQE